MGQGPFGVGGLGLYWLQDAVEFGTLVLREDEPSKEDGEASAERPPWDLLERTALFGERIVKFARAVPRHPANDRLINQVVGAGTSIGGNYCEANAAVSTKDFRYTISRCVKEAKETKFFIRMIVASEPDMAEQARPLYREAHELLRIFASMRRKSTIEP